MSSSTRPRSRPSRRASTSTPTADGQVSDEEIEAGRDGRAATTSRGSLDLRVGQVAQTLTLAEAGLAFPPGAGGLSTMRQVCGFRVGPRRAARRAARRVTFADTSFAERLGWREIVVAAPA